MSIHTANMPPITKEAALDIKERFKPITINKDTGINEIMINTGQQQVVNFIMANAVGKVPVQYREPEPEIEKRDNIFVRAWKWVKSLWK